MASKNPGFNIPLRDRAESGWQRQRHQEIRLRGSIASQPAPASERAEAPGPCAHHWKIATPNGTFSDAVCRKCGAEKQFRNSSEDTFSGEQFSGQGS